MSFSLRQNPTTFLKPHLLPLSRSPTRLHSHVDVRVRCGGGPRSHRGPLVKGRILSIEAIQAIQTLKRLHRTNPPNLPHLLSATLTRLLKSDLLATLRELLRQQQCALALRVFSTLRSEHGGADLSLYAEMVQALGNADMSDDVDRLVEDLEEGGIQCDDYKGLVSLIKAVVVARRRESTVRVYELMKRSGWGTEVEPDDYVVKVLVGGLRSFGEEMLAEEVKSESIRAMNRFSRARLEGTLRIL